MYAAREDMAVVEVTEEDAEGRPNEMDMMGNPLWRPLSTPDERSWKKK